MKRRPYGGEFGTLAFLGPVQRVERAIVASVRRLSNTWAVDGVVCSNCKSTLLRSEPCAQAGPGLPAQARAASVQWPWPMAVATGAAGRHRAARAACGRAVVGGPQLERSVSADLLVSVRKSDMFGRWEYAEIGAPSAVIVVARPGGVWRLASWRCGVLWVKL